MATAPMGMGPFGATQAGALASWVGPPITMAIGAGASAVVLLAVRVFSPTAFTLEPDDYPT